MFKNFNIVRFGITWPKRVEMPLNPSINHYSRHPPPPLVRGYQCGVFNYKISGGHCINENHPTSIPVIIVIVYA